MLVPNRLPRGSTATGPLSAGTNSRGRFRSALTFPCSTEVVELTSSILFVPARPIRQNTGTSAGFGLEVRQLTSGEYGCLAFTSLVRLVDVLGDFQPWVGLPEDVLGQEMVRTGVAALYVDSDLPAEAWRWQQTSMEAFEEQSA